MPSCPTFSEESFTSSRNSPRNIKIRGTRCHLVPRFRRRFHMRKAAMYVISLIFAGAVVIVLAQNPPQQTPPGQPAPGQQAGRGGGQPAPTPPGPPPNSQYRLGP